jgi:hypothetical protein
LMTSWLEKVLWSKVLLPSLTVRIVPRLVQHGLFGLVWRLPHVADAVGRVCFRVRGTNHLL